MDNLEKSILKKKKKNNYTSISNDLLQDTSLSFEARGLAASLLSRPDDWEINVAALMMEGKIGRDKANKIIQELIKAGYMYKSQSRTSGKFGKNILYISDEKDYLFEEIIEKDISLTENPSTVEKTIFTEVSPLTEKTVTVKPVTGSPLTENPEQQIKESTNTKKQITTTELQKKSSSRYEFLESKKYPLLNVATIKNIRDFIQDLTEEKMDHIYSLIEKEKELGNVRSFNAVLYKALKGEWGFVAESKKKNSVQDDENKIKAEYAQYEAMYRECGNFDFAFENFKNSIAKFGKEITEKYIEQFKKLE